MRIIEKKMKTTTQGLGFRAQVRHVQLRPSSLNPTLSSISAQVYSFEVQYKATAKGTLLPLAGVFVVEDLGQGPVCTRMGQYVIRYVV